MQLKTNPDKYDPVEHPKHYNSSGAECDCGRRIECIDITRNMGFNLGNVVKYVWRHQDKNGIEDLKKARWYLDDYIRNREELMETYTAPGVPSNVSGVPSNV